MYIIHTYRYNIILLLIPIYVLRVVGKNKYHKTGTYLLPTIILDYYYVLGNIL